MITYRGHKFSGYNQPKRNDGPGKHKKMVLAKQGDKVRLIRFGHKGYGHNINPKRKANYLKRSAGIRDKSGKLTKNNKLSANYWARRTLWPRNKPTMAEKRANLDLLKKYRNDIGGALGGSVLGGAVGYGSGHTDKDGKSNRLKRSLIGATAGGLTGLGFGRMSRHLGESKKRVSSLQEQMRSASQEHADRVRDLEDTNTRNLGKLRENLEAAHGAELNKRQQDFSDLTALYNQRDAELTQANTNLGDLKKRLKSAEESAEHYRAKNVELEKDRDHYREFFPRADRFDDLESRARLRKVTRAKNETDDDFLGRVEAAERRYQEDVNKRLKAQEMLDSMPDVPLNRFVGTGRK